jgi:hypothetical protein
MYEERGGVEEFKRRVLIKAQVVSREDIGDRSKVRLPGALSHLFCFFSEHGNFANKKVTPQRRLPEYQKDCPPRQQDQRWIFINFSQAPIRTFAYAHAINRQVSS